MPGCVPCNDPFSAATPLSKSQQGGHLINNNDNNHNQWQAQDDPFAMFNEEQEKSLETSATAKLPLSPVPINLLGADEDEEVEDVFQQAYEQPEEPHYLIPTEPEAEPEAEAEYEPEEVLIAPPTPNPTLTSPALASTATIIPSFIATLPVPVDLEDKIDDLETALAQARAELDQHKAELDNEKNIKAGMEQQIHQVSSR